MNKFFAATLGMTLTLGLAAGTTSTTLANLQTAYNGESNAKAKYEGYAKKAVAEGHLGVAGLFRAAAKAEGIHADAHATVIKSMGAVPKAEIKTPDPLSTTANLKDALEGEMAEKDTMYPDFIKVAKTEGNKAALQSFTYAKTAEGEHAKLYAQALNNLGEWKAAKSFYVCTVCGYTVPKVAFGKCPSCFNPKDTFIEV